MAQVKDKVKTPDLGINTEKAGSLSTPNSANGNMTQGATNVNAQPVKSLGAIQDQLHNFADTKIAEGQALIQIAQNVNAAIANPEFKLGSKELAEFETNRLLTTNYFTKQAGKSRLEATILDSARASLIAAEEAYHAAGNLSNAEDAKNWSETRAEVRDFNAVKYEFEAKNAGLTAESTQSRFEQRYQRWTGKPWQQTVDVEASAS